MSDIEARGGAESSKTSGYGLGLFLSLQLARFFNGDIKIDSEVDQGTEVIISISAEVGSTDLE